MLKDKLRQLGEWLKRKSEEYKVFAEQQRIKNIARLDKQIEEQKLQNQLLDKRAQLTKLKAKHAPKPSQGSPISFSDSGLDMFSFKNDKNNKGMKEMFKL